MEAHGIPPNDWIVSLSVTQHTILSTRTKREGLILCAVWSTRCTGCTYGVERWIRGCHCLNAVMGGWSGLHAWPRRPVVVRVVPQHWSLGSQERRRNCGKGRDENNCRSATGYASPRSPSHKMSSRRGRVPPGTWLSTGASWASPNISPAQAPA